MNQNRIVLAIAFFFASTSALAHIENAAGFPTTKALEVVNQGAVINSIHHTNLLEISEATETLPKLQNEEVRNFANMMMMEHQENEKALLNLAATKSLPLYPFQKSTYETASDDQILRIPDSEMDRGFLMVQIQGHQRSLNNVMMLKMQITDPEVKAFADETATSMKKHLMQALKLYITVIGRSRS